MFRRKRKQACYFDFMNLLAEMVRLNNEEKPTGEIYKTGDKAGLAKTVKGDFNGKLTGVINTMQDKLLIRDIHSCLEIISRSIYSRWLSRS